MGFVPNDAKWFLADLVVEHRIEGDPRNVVHINTVLVRADSAEEAYDKAIELGSDSELQYENTEGKSVTLSFRGLGDLFVILDELEHGAELIYSEKVGLSEEQVLGLVRPKSSLGVFRDIEPKKGPNYMPKGIMDMLVDRLGEDAMTDFLGRGDRP